DASLNILCDPGWDCKTDLTYLEDILPSINVILLSHPTFQCIGAYAILYKNNSLLSRIPVYSTFPISTIGRVETIERYRSAGLVGPIFGAPLEINDIETSFDSILLLKHHQSINLNINNFTIVLTPLNAGHTLGGINWLLNYSGEKYIYAPEWNHSRDSYLEGANLISQENLFKPSVFITSTNVGSSLSYKKRVNKFLELIDATLHNGGSAILPVSLGSRLLELVHIVDVHLRSLPFIPVLLISKTGTRALTYAGKMLEWMSPSVIKEWTTNNGNNSGGNNGGNGNNNNSNSNSGNNKNSVPFDASRVELADAVELPKYIGPKVVFCVGQDIEVGSESHSAFIQLCNDHRTTIILTERPQRNTLGYDLYSKWELLCKQKNDGKVIDGIPVPYESSFKTLQVVEEKLNGNELKNYFEILNSRRKAEVEMKEKEEMERKSKSKSKSRSKMKRKSGSISKEDGDNTNGDNDIDEDEDEDDDDDDNDKDGIGEDKKRGKIKIRLNEENDESSKKMLEKERNKMLIDRNVLRIVSSRKKVFPFEIEKMKYDDYGEIFNLDEIVKKDANNGNSGLNGNAIFKGVVNDKSGKNGRNHDDGGNKMNEKNSNNHNHNHNYNYNHNNDNEGDEMIEFDSEFEPKKQILNRVGIIARCGLTFIDLSGHVDLRSLRVILQNIKPKKIILMKDLTYERNDELVKNTLISINKSSQVKTFEVIESFDNTDISIDKIFNNFEVKLDDELIKKLKWQKITGGVSIAHLYGQVSDKPEDESASRQLSKNRDKSVKRIELKNVNSSSLLELSNIKNNPLAIGDIKLSELKKILIEKYESLNYKIEFKGEGVLVINENVSIKKFSEGDVVIDGRPNKLYYEVREIVCGLLAYV
ncbi:cleavage polyadenylation factor subunit CFT2 ASCRUDRAFT_20476, partial [Ascoidea rubescens DSM 1968]